MAMDRLLDYARTGPLHLRRPEIARMVVEALHYHEQYLEHYHLHSYAVMPNHVHFLITPRVPVSRLMQSLRRVTAREGNRILSLAGLPFWQEESCDHPVRNGEEFGRLVGYIESNPVHAGLAAAPEEFPWSSARPIANRTEVTYTPYLPPQM